MENLEDLRSRFARPGQVEWIGIARERQGTIEVVDRVDVVAPTGIAGEHHATNGKSKRQVTLIQAEHLQVVASLLGRETVPPESVRRNIVVSGVNLIALKDQDFRIGSAVLRGTGSCVPCSRMEWSLGPGGYNAMRGHGGLNAVVVEDGEIHVGDELTPICTKK